MAELVQDWPGTQDSTAPRGACPWALRTAATGPAALEHVGLGLSACSGPFWGPCGRLWGKVASQFPKGKRGSKPRWGGQGGSLLTLGCRQSSVSAGQSLSRFCPHLTDGPDGRHAPLSCSLGTGPWTESSPSPRPAWLPSRIRGWSFLLPPPIPAPGLPSTARGAQVQTVP